MCVCVCVFAVKLEGLWGKWNWKCGYRTDTLLTGVISNVSTIKHQEMARPLFRLSYLRGRGKKIKKAPHVWGGGGHQSAESCDIAIVKRGHCLLEEAIVLPFIICYIELCTSIIAFFYDLREIAVLLRVRVRFILSSELIRASRRKLASVTQRSFLPDSRRIELCHRR